MSVKDADERFAARTIHVGELRQELADCFATAPQTEQMDRLLVRARDLLAVLGADMKKIEEDLGPGYDLDQFQALTDQIDQVVDNVAHIPLIYLYDVLVRTLPPDWRPVRGTGGHVWFRGSSLGNALPVLQAGHFDSNVTFHGAAFGVGTYFARNYDEAEQYGECVFGMNSPGAKILRVKIQLELHPPAPDPGWQRIETLDIEGDIDELLGWTARTRLRDAANRGKTLTQIAREQEYDAVEFLECDEGHILVVLKNLPVTAANLVFIKVFK
jgi:hypothetical protein